MYTKYFEKFEGLNPAAVAEKICAIEQAELEKDKEYIRLNKELLKIKSRLASMDPYRKSLDIRDEFKKYLLDKYGPSL